MTNELTTLIDTLGGAEGLANALQVRAHDVAPNTIDGHILKMPDGQWVYGAENTAVEDDDVFAVAVNSLQSGYVAWKDNRPLDQRMAKVGQAPIDINTLPTDLGVNTIGFNKGKPVTWTAAMSINMQGVEGPVKSQRFLYNPTSHGGRQAISQLFDQIVDRLQADPDSAVPLIRLDSYSYENKNQGGRLIYNPVFEIVNWGDNDGNVVEEAPAPTTRRRRRSA